MDALAVAEDVFLHLRMPLGRLVPEMGAGLQELYKRWNLSHNDVMPFYLSAAPHGPLLFRGGATSSVSADVK
jgi:hypothetical protein